VLVDTQAAQFCLFHFLLLVRLFVSGEFIGCEIAQQFPNVERVVWVRHTSLRKFAVEFFLSF
jgi:hypothetical protein